MEDRDFGREIDTLRERVGDTETAIDSINKCMADIDKRYNADIATIMTKLSYIESNIGNMNAYFKWVVMSVLSVVLVAILNMVMR